MSEPGLAPLARLAVVVPVGPHDAVAAVLREQLRSLPADAQVFEVRAAAPAPRSAPPAEPSARGAGGVAAPACAGAAPRHRGPGRRVLHSAPGRAVQQNAGARAADRAWLWFLHADSVLSPTALPALARFLAAEDEALGYFDLRFLNDGPMCMHLNAFGARARSRWFGLPFGDQGFVVPRAAFERLGGFDPRLASGEDHDLVWRARRAGLPLRPVGAPLYSSARRYARHGWWRTTAWHLAQTARQAWRFSRRRDPA